MPRRTNRSRVLQAVFLAAVLPFGGAAMPARAATLRLAVDHRAGAGPLVLNALRARNSAGETYSITRLSYLLSGVALQRADGSWFSLPDSLAWLNAATRRDTMQLSGVPAGRYRALRFHVGIDPAANGTDPATRAPDHPLNPNLNGLHWSWQGGYIFMALEGLYQAGDSQARGYALHLAREPFRTQITLEGQIEVGEDTVIPVAFDVAAVLDGTRKISFARDGPTTHSRDGDPLAEALRENLASAFAIGPGAAKPAPAAAASSVGQPVSARSPLTPYPFKAGKVFPVPALPSDNPLTEDRVALGRQLFHETALSRDGTLSCASCHLPMAALSDPRRFSVGVDGRVGDRNAMPLFNLAWKSRFFWDGRATSLREQALMPIEDHREMDESLERVVEKLSLTKRLPEAFGRAFGSPGITPARIGLAVESFLLTRTSHDSKFDRAQQGQAALSEEEQRGFELFMTEREPRLGILGADCFHCHGGALFTDHQFRNNGLAIAETDLGRFRVTRAAIDRGSFATPSLRNVALTAPYMHDGRFATLEEVVDHYSEGVQRTDTLDPNLAKHPDGGLHLSAEEKRSLIAFLRTLTDSAFARPPSEKGDE